MKGLFGNIALGSEGTFQLFFPTVSLLGGLFRESRVIGIICQGETLGCMKATVYAAGLREAKEAGKRRKGGRERGMEGEKKTWDPDL